MIAPRDRWGLTPQEIEASFPARAGQASSLPESGSKGPQASAVPPVAEAETRPLAGPPGRGAPGAPITGSADDIFAAIRRGFGG